ncbi:hypothetical protein Harman_11920 [Haloarcula mannanilytica]|uniref:Uncharacterized protein n=1 Tax=Haloarcula mannanilytica TaxID=2509225 RepID=A0A4C2EHP8_9EURY|nr:hypothetical protein [Haloarcula mannanilytica]GCF13257.1 hypothetical protein Harman_11920 [Haloarcula mannanilytica]
MSTEPFAQPKAIGMDVETLVVDAIDVIEAAADADDHFDAVTTGLFEPSTAAAGVPVRWSTPLVEAGSPLEIKACIRKRSKGSTTAHGSWCFKGRETGQHGWLLDHAETYLLVVYESDATKEVAAIAVVPASIVDEHLRGRWYDVDRSEETCAQLRWSEVLDPEVVGGER